MGGTVSSDRDAQMAKLASLRGHVLDNREIVERQRAMVYALHLQGRAAGQSLILLAKFEQTLAAAERDLAALQAEVGTHTTSD
jgi:hypothetical protein